MEFEQRYKKIKKLVERETCTALKRNSLRCYINNAFSSVGAHKADLQE